MTRGLRLFLVGSVVLVSLAGCVGTWVEEREAWRRDAEIACIKSGAVKENVAIVQAPAINGPGACGADYPFKVTALGDGTTTLGFADTPRPPGGIGGGGAAARRDLPMEIIQPRSQPVRQEGYQTGGYQTGGYQSGGYRDGGFRDSSRDAGRDVGSQLPRDPSEDDEEEAPAQAERGRDLPPLGPAEPRNLTGGNASAIQPTATLACPMVSQLDKWVSTVAQPAAQRWFGQPIVEIKQISSYSCRRRNGARTGKISEHAFGNALDVAGFTLADGRKVTVKNGWRGEPEEQGFLRDVHAGACQMFTTVLGPGSNIYHYDHFHFDLARQGRGRTICNPAAIPGEVIARRLGGGTVTGSVRPKGYSPRMGFAPEEDSKLQRAQPGED